MFTYNAHYMNASFELTIWNVTAENDWNEKRQNFFCFHSKRCFARNPRVQEYLSD